jgi:hypothetical protein
MRVHSRETLLEKSEKIYYGNNLSNEQSQVCNACAS